jgi:hypothetical protein
MTQAKLTLPITPNLPLGVNSPQDMTRDTETGYMRLPQRTVEVVKTPASSIWNPTYNGVAVFNHAGETITGRAM